MAYISVDNLYKTGVELFQDSESYLNEFNNLDTVHGGTVSGGYLGGTAGIYDLVTKGYEFGVYTIGIDAISHLVKSFSYSGGYSHG
jgi:hypothetical protein